MNRTNSTSMSFRTTDQVKELLRKAAKQDHRSISSMIEKLIYDHAEKLGLCLPTAEPGQGADHLQGGLQLLPGRLTRKNPAMKLGLAEGVVALEDILYFSQ